MNRTRLNNTAGNFPLFVIFAIAPFFAGAVSAPTINVAPAVYYPLDETLYIEGGALPNSMVELRFEKPDTQPVRLTAASNSNGEWFISEKLELASGEWMVRARIADDPPSDWSTPRIIRSVVSGFVVGSVRIKYAPVIIVLAVLLAASAALFGYSVIRVRTVRRLDYENQMKERAASLERELHEKERRIAGTLVEENFSELKRKINEELDHLEEKARKGESLSNDEAAHRHDLLRQLRETEERIEQKIKEIT